VIRLIRRECRTSLTANRGYWHVRPMSVSVTLTLAPGCPSWPLHSRLGYSNCITDGGGMADMQRVSNRPVLSKLITQVAALRQAEMDALCPAIREAQPPTRRPLLRIEGVARS
jgi:hypothetical protein